MRQVDFLVVGQGLAGSCLSLELLKRGYSFVVIDMIDLHSASRVAAGLFNPITGKTMKPTWRSEEFFPYLHNFYKDAESFLETKFFHPLPIYRPFVSENEMNDWKAKKSPFVQEVRTAPFLNKYVNDPFGGILLNNSGFLNTNLFIDATRSHLLKKDALWNESFDFDLLLLGNKMRYKNSEADLIIFCDGIGALNNPYLHWLPIRKLKGETLLAEIHLPGNYVINRGVFAVPAQDGSNFWIGSTYHHDNSEGNTPKGMEEMKEKMKKLFRVPFEIREANWGHRPTTPNRRPILGRHPKHLNLLVFNGLGTKGVSLAPYFAAHLLDWYEGKSGLDNSVNIERFYSLYFKSKEDNAQTE